MLTKKITAGMLSSVFLLACLQLFLTSITQAAVNPLPVIQKAWMKPDPPKPGQNIKQLEGHAITPFDEKKMMEQAKDLPKDIKEAALAGKTCIFYWDAEDDQNLCRYLVFYDCYTGGIIWVSEVP